MLVINLKNLTLQLIMLIMILLKKKIIFLAIEDLKNQKKKITGDVFQ